MCKIYYRFYMDYYKVMALDYGEVRIGVAMTDLMRLIASPFETYVRKSLDQDLDHICTLINNNSVKTVVVGLPLNMDGTEGERAQKTREFVDVLKTKTNVEFVFQDERLSSVSAEELLLEGAAYDNDKTYIPLTERYYFPKYGHENSKLAAYWAYRAYTAGISYVSYYMGLFYYYGDFFPKAPAYAKYYLEKFVDLGGDTDVSDMLEDKALKKVTGIKPSKQFGDTLPDNFFGCEDPEALFERGGAMLNGYDADKNPVKQDIEGGIALIRNAAEQGYAKALIVLGLCFEETDRPCPTFAEDGSLDIYKSDV